MIEVDLRIESVANLREHWSQRARRAKVHREVIGWSLKTTKKPALPCVVTLTRIAPRPLDSHDNLRIGCKAAVDAVADWLDVKDNDSRLDWRYGQDKADRYALRIEFA